MTLLLLSDFPPSTNFTGGQSLAEQCRALAPGSLVAFIALNPNLKPAPAEDLVIKSDVFKKHKKSPVTFSHKKHKGFECTRCHHEMKDGKNVWKKGQEVKKCGACHKLKKEGKVKKLEKAFHDQCQQCHKKLKKAKKKTGPTSCTKCHPKKKKKK